MKNGRKKLFNNIKIARFNSSPRSSPDYKHVSHKLSARGKNK